MNDFKDTPKALNPENRIEYHFTYENFTELFADIKEAFMNIVK